MLTVVAGLLAVVVCVALNAFFVAAEFALVTVRRTWVEELSQGSHKAAPAVKRSVTRLDDSIAATQLGITVASLALGWLGEPAVAALIEPVLKPLLPVWHTAAAHSVATAIAFAAITVLHVVLGELAPKAVALGRPEAVALQVARPMVLFQRVFHPVIWALNAVGNAVVRALGLPPLSAAERAHSVGELKMLVAETHDAGELDPTQAEVVRHALELTDKRVRDVMVPLEQATTLELEATDREVLDAIYASQHTRMPVYSRTRRRFVGVANTKLVMLQFLRDGRVDLRAAMFRPAVFHNAAPLPRVLRSFKLSRHHMGFVVADDGTKIGIVTLEDVLEELVGEIDDELDVVDEDDDAPEPPPLELLPEEEALVEPRDRGAP